VSGGLEEPRRLEVLRLLKLAGGRLEEAHNDLLRFEATRADGQTVKAASLVLCCRRDGHGRTQQRGPLDGSCRPSSQHQNARGLFGAASAGSAAGHDGSGVNLPGRRARAITVGAPCFRSKRPDVAVGLLRRHLR
jgi:hypothetical protein